MILWTFSLTAPVRRRQGVRPFLPTPCRPLRARGAEHDEQHFEFLLRTHRCFAVASRLLVPPFSGRTKRRAKFAKAAKATGMPVGLSVPAMPDSRSISRISCRKRGSSRVPPIARMPYACRLLRQVCLKLATSRLDATQLPVPGPCRKLQDCGTLRAAELAA